MNRTTRAPMLPIVERRDLSRRVAGIPGMAPGTRAYTMGECRILLSPEPDGLHLSISCEDRYPTWDEIAEARYRLMPRDSDVVMHLPPESEYVNVHENTFHLHEQKRPRLVAAR